MSKGRERKPHIGIFGRRNSGKSTLINLLAGQDIAIVSDTPGTTTDPVKKSMELKGVGAVVMIDTAGVDDVGELGSKRIQKSKQVLKLIDLAILVISGNVFNDTEENLIHQFSEMSVPYLIIHNKSDLSQPEKELINKVKDDFKQEIIEFSALYPKNPKILFNKIKEAIPASAFVQPSLLGDLVQYGDVILLIVPIDAEAPEGRLILPQVQTIRDILDNDCVAIVLKEREVDSFLRKTEIKPKLVVTDSSLFLKADASIPKDIPLTGFSILLAKYKGEFQDYLKGTPYISKLKDGDRILLLESCTHQVSCDDIGRVKIPRWITSFTGKNLNFDIVSGLDELNRDICDYAMVIQCGGCMVTRRQLSNRLKPAIKAGIPVSNYGMTIAYVQGIYDRAIKPFVKDFNSEDDYL